MKRTPTHLVTTSWLEGNLGKVRVLDATWFLKSVHGDRDAEKEFLACRIPTAQRFDLDELADHATDLPHMLLPAKDFAARMESMGIGSDDEVVVYDALGMFSAARAWWNLFVFGCDSAKLLDGGLPKWKAEGRRVESGPVAVAPMSKKRWIVPTQASVDAKVSRLEEVLELAKKPNVTANNAGNLPQIVDARPPGRFTGADPEPRPGLKRGKIPGSVNVPFKSLLNEQDGTFKSRAEIQSILSAKGVDLSGRRKVITTCGSGTTAAVVSFALINFFPEVKTSLYDGSFAEYGKVEKDLPVAVEQTGGGASKL